LPSISEDPDRAAALAGACASPLPARAQNEKRPARADLSPKTRFHIMSLTILLDPGRPKTGQPVAINRLLPGEELLNG